MEKQNKMYRAEDILITTHAIKPDTLHYELKFANNHYDIFYKHGCVKIEKNKEQVFFQHVSEQADESWDDNETAVYLHWIKKAIRNGTVEVLKLPRKSELFIKE